MGSGRVSPALQGGSEQVKVYCCSPGSALSCVHREGCLCGLGANILGLHSMVAPRGGGRDCLRGEELPFSSTSRKKDLGV